MTKIEIWSKSGKEYFPHLTFVPRVGEGIRLNEFSPLFVVTHIVYVNKGYAVKVYVEEAAGED